MANDLRVRTDIRIAGAADIDGALDVGGALNVVGVSTFPGGIGGNASFTGALVTFQNDVAINDDLTVTGDLVVSGAFSFSGGSIFPDDTFRVHAVADVDKELAIDLSGASTGFTSTLVFNQTANRSIEFPDSDAVLVGETDAQTLTNKTIDADLNTLSNIEDADIKSGAAISRAKLASGTMAHVLINDGSGVMSSEAQLAPVRGGTGQDFSASTGVIKVAAGAFTAATILNADVDAAAAIARTKLASGTADHVLINDGSGVMSSEASLDETRGGTAQSTYAAGDLLYASASNTLSKLPIGTAGQILKTGDAGLPTWEDTNYPIQETRLFEDWHTDAVGQMRWLDADLTTGVSATTIAVADSAHAGILELNTGAGATGFACRYLGGVATGTGTAGFIIGGGVLTMDWLVRVEDLSTAGERYSFQFGLFDTASTSNDFIRIFYTDTVNSGNWSISAGSAAIGTNTDSGVPVVADTWYRIRAVVNAAGTSIEYFINGVSVGTVSTNLPAGVIAPRCSMTKSVGTTPRIAYIDYFRLYQRLTVAR